MSRRTRRGLHEKLHVERPSTNLYDIDSKLSSKRRQYIVNEQPSQAYQSTPKRSGAYSLIQKQKDVEESSTIGTNNVDQRPPSPTV